MENPSSESWPASFQMFSTYEIAESIAVEAALARCIHVCTTELKNGHAGLASEASTGAACAGPGRHLSSCVGVVSKPGPWSLLIHPGSSWMWMGRCDPESCIAFWHSQLS